MTPVDLRSAPMVRLAALAQARPRSEAPERPAAPGDHFLGASGSFHAPPASLPGRPEVLRSWTGPMLAGRDVVVASDQVQRGQALLESLSPEESARWSGLFAQAPSDLHRAFVFKAVAAAHPLDEVSAFAERISSMYPEELVPSLTLRDVIQQHAMSCEVTEGQMLLGERDPLYALEHRLANPDLGKVANADPYEVNWRFGHEQRVVLTSFGGRPGKRSLSSGGGIPPERSTAYWNSMSGRTGLTFGPRQEARSAAEAWEVIQAQLARHLPTPLTVAGVGGSHAVLALPVEGQDPTLLTLHDPYSGRLHAVTREQVLRGELPLSGWNKLTGYRLAQPAEPGVFHPTVSLEALADLPPPPPPHRRVQASSRVTDEITPVAALDAEEKFKGWVYPAFDYDYRGQRVVGSRRYEDVEGNAVAAPVKTSSF